MGAYAALLSLSQTLNHTLIHDPDPRLFKKDQLLSLQQNVTTLLTFLKQHSHVQSSESINLLETRIINVAYCAQDVVERSYISNSLVADFMELCISMCWPKLERNVASLRDVLREMDFILTKINDYCAVESATSSSLVLPDPAISSNCSINTRIFEDDFLAIRNRIHRQSSDLEAIPIFGMGGIGKSTLAKRLPRFS